MLVMSEFADKSKALRIALVGPLVERIPPPKYGGTERVVHGLAEELVSLGHEVTLFASGDSQTRAELFSVSDRPLRELSLEDFWHYNYYAASNIGLAYNQQHRFDVIHDHNWPPHFVLPIANMATVPTVYTLHGPYKYATSLAEPPSEPGIFKWFRKTQLVTISQKQAEEYAAVVNGNLKTVHNGLQMEHYPYQLTAEPFLLYIGRFCFDKAAHLAIEVAQRLNMKLVLAAKLDDQEIPYFEKYVKPHLDNRLITWIGEVDEQQRNRLMCRATAMLHPITWEEPFGLTIIESMACGCPVIAMNRGSMPELIVDGETGYLPHNIDEMVEAVKKVDQIDRWLCRRHALKNFSASLMAKRYLEIYYDSIERRARRAALLRPHPTTAEIPVFMEKLNKKRKLESP